MGVASRPKGGGIVSPLTLTRILMLFGSLSLLSIGGGNTIVSQMHVQAVHNYDWMSDRQFADLFAIAQSAPGPSILIVTLIGYRAGMIQGGLAGGILGAILATVAMVLPAALLVFWVSHFWQKAAKSNWRQAVEKGFAPLTVGLILATAYTVSQSADHGIRGYAMTAAATLIFATTRLNPLWLVAVGGFIGWMGWV